MNASSSTKFAIGVTVGTVVIFVAAFMSWSLNRSPFVKTPPTSIERVDRESQTGGPVVAITFPKRITGWNSYIAIGALKLPNWVVVLAAGALTVLSWLKAFSVWQVPAVMPFALAAYGLLHAGLAYVIQFSWRISSRPVQGGAIEEGGALLTAVAFVGILLVLVQQVRSPGQEATPNQSLNPTGNRPAS